MLSARNKHRKTFNQKNQLQIYDELLKIIMNIILQSKSIHMVL